MFWKPVDVEPRLSTLGKDSSLFLQRIHDKYFLFIFELELTFLIVLSTEGSSLVVDGVKKITSQRTILKVAGNNNCILMLDVEKELYYLQGTLGSISEIFNISNAKKFITSDAVLSWQRQQLLTGCLAMTGITNGVSFLFLDVSVYAALYRSDDLKNGLSKISCNMLNDFNEGWKYFTITLKEEMARIVGERVIKSLVPAKEILLIIEPSQIIFILPTPEGQIISQPYQIDFQSDVIINVMSFEKKKLILIVCESGKMVCLRFDNSTKLFQFRHAWLPKSILDIVGYEDGIIYLLWSDLSELYLSTLDDDNIIRNIKVFYNMRHVRHFVKVHDYVLVITMDGCVYQTKIYSFPNEDMQCSSSEFLDKMLHTSKLTENLTKEVVAKEHLIEAFNISGKHNISKDIHITKKEGLIILENKTEYLFRKKLWRLWLETEDMQRKYMKIKEVENDITPGGSITIKCDKLPTAIILVCDILDKATCVVLNLKDEENISDIKSGLITIQEFLKDKCNFMA